MRQSIRVLTATAAVWLITGCAVTDPVYSGADAPEPPTGSRIPANGREDPNRKTVVDREEIDASGAMTVEQVLRRRVIR